LQIEFITTAVRTSNPIYYFIGHRKQKKTTFYITVGIFIITDIIFMTPRS
jgi:hypothetical protein